MNPIKCQVQNVILRAALIEIAKKHGVQTKAEILIGEPNKFPYFWVNKSGCGFTSASNQEIFDYSFATIDEVLIALERWGDRIVDSNGNDVNIDKYGICLKTVYINPSNTEKLFQKWQQFKKN